MEWLGHESRLPGPLRKALRGTILACIDRDDLRMAISDSASSRDYDQLVAEADFETEVDELIGKAFKQGWLDELIAIVGDTTERADIKAQLHAITAALAEQPTLIQRGEDRTMRVRVLVVVAAGLFVAALLLLAFRFPKKEEPNYVVRLAEGGEPVRGRPVFVAEIGADGAKGHRFDEVTNAHGEAFFSLELGTSRLYLFGVRSDQGSECTFPAFNVIEKREALFQLDGDGCLDALGGVEVRSVSTRQPADLASVGSALPTDVAARRSRAPLGLPAAPVVLDRRYYSVGFDPSIRSPRWVSFTVDTQRALRLPRLPDQFEFDPDIPKNWQTGDDVYRFNSYDRGTLVRRSDAAIGSTEADARASEAEIFYYSVTVPQAAVTNQKTWLSVELYTTETSRRLGQIHVVSGPIYPDLSSSNSAYLTLGSSRTVVPLSLFRVLLRKSESGRWRAIAFLVPNDGSDGRDPKAFATSIAAVEEATGLKFFVDLPTDQVKALKANTSLAEFES